MPQMSPMNWMALFILFWAGLFMVMSKMYYMSTLYTKSSLYGKTAKIGDPFLLLL